MKKEIFAGAVIILLLTGAAVYYQLNHYGRAKFSDHSPNPWPKELTKLERAMTASEPAPDKGAMAVAELPEAITAAIKQALPKAVVTQATRDKKDRFNLKLTREGNASTAKFRMTEKGAVGSIIEHLKPGDLPAPVAEAYQKAKPDGVVNNLNKVTVVGGDEDGRVVYEWEFGHNANAEASADGKRLILKDEVGKSELPQAAVDAINQALPGSTLADKAERINKNGQTSFVIEVRKADNGKKVDVRVTASGELQKY